MPRQVSQSPNVDRAYAGIFELRGSFAKVQAVVPWVRSSVALGEPSWDDMAVASAPWPRGLRRQGALRSLRSSTSAASMLVEAAASRSKQAPDDIHSLNPHGQGCEARLTWASAVPATSPRNSCLTA